MANAFLSVVREAVDRGWCTKMYCTTCGAHDYRRALRELGGPLGSGLREALCAVSARELIQIRGWDGALLIAVGDLPIGLADVLEAWLPRIGDCPRFDDVVTYRVVRQLSHTSPQREAWMRAIIPAAVQARDPSLIESIMLVQSTAAAEHPELMRVAKELATGYPRLARVLRAVVGVSDAPMCKTPSRRQRPSRGRPT